MDGRISRQAQHRRGELMTREEPKQIFLWVTKGPAAVQW